MISHLSRLLDLRVKIKQANMLGKAALAADIGEESFQLAMIVVERILKLEEEVASWKKKQQQSH